MKLLTIGDFYRRRYGRDVEVAASIMMIFSFCILLAGNLGGFLLERFLGTSYAFGVALIVGVVLDRVATVALLVWVYAPVELTILVLSGIVAASCSTANGAILGTAAVAARNVVGVQLEDDARGKCRLLEPPGSP